MTGLDGEGHAIIPPHSGAGVIGGWAFAADLVQAVPLAGTFIIKAFHVLARIKMGAAVAFVMNTLGVEHFGPPLPVKFGQAVKGEHVGNNAGHHLGNGGAAGHLDNGFVQNNLVHRGRLCGVGPRGLHTAIRGA